MTLMSIQEHFVDLIDTWTCSRLGEFCFKKLILPLDEWDLFCIAVLYAFASQTSNEAVEKPAFQSEKKRDHIWSASYCVIKN